MCQLMQGPPGGWGPQEQDFVNHQINDDLSYIFTVYMPHLARFFRNRTEYFPNNLFFFKKENKQPRENQSV